MFKMMRTSKVSQTAAEAGRRSQIASKKAAIQTAEETYLKQMSESDKLIMSGKPLESLTIKALTTIVKPFKRNGDKALPKKKQELIELFEKWKSRSRRKFDYTEMDQFLSSHNVHNNDNNDATANGIFDDAGIANA